MKEATKVDWIMTYYFLPFLYVKNEHITLSVINANFSLFVHKLHLGGRGIKTHYIYSKSNIYF